jgi:hypothetical protein
MNKVFICLTVMVSLVGSGLSFAFLPDQSERQVAFPDGYREWAHVKSVVILEGHEHFEDFGGIHHVYANDKALSALKKGKPYEQGAIFTFDRMEAQPDNNLIVEGSRLVVSVMEKDPVRFADTKGWGFEDFKFEGEKYQPVVTDAKAQCMSCHQTQVASDFVFSKYRTSHGQESNSSKSDSKQEDQEFSPFVDQEGNIERPKNYKMRWSHLGGFAVAKKEGQTVFEIHDVYTQPETIEAFRKTGKFPDGAVLVKEVRGASAAKLTAGHSAWSTEIKVWFVMVKDSQGRFPNNKSWGNGWGWALFEAKEPDKNVTTNFKTSCLGCHIPAKKDDWIYVRGYPELKVPAASTSVE